MIRIAVLLPRYSPAERTLRERALRASASASVDLGFIELPGVAGGSALTEYHRSLVAPTVARAARGAEVDGYDAIVTWGTLDLGVEESRHVVSIPVLGPGRTTAMLAATLVERFGVICHGELQVAMFRRLTSSWGVSGRIVGIRSAQVPPAEITRPDAQTAFDAHVSAGRALIGDGAQAIAPLGLSVVPVSVAARDLADAIGAPVLNPLAITIGLAEALAATGAGNSRVAYPPVILEDSR